MRVDPILEVESSASFLLASECKQRGLVGSAVTRQLVGGSDGLVCLLRGIYRGLPW